VPEDLDRRFIISFYLADDTISIYEPAQKNSGIIPGKFLHRNKYKNVDNNMDFLTPTDMATTRPTTSTGTWCESIHRRSTLVEGRQKQHARDSSQREPFNKNLQR
jgi:hypothetical protein